MDFITDTKSGRKRKQSLLEDLEEFVDVIGVDYLGSLEEMELFSLEPSQNSNKPKANESLGMQPLNSLARQPVQVPESKLSKFNVIMESDKVPVVKKQASKKPALQAADIDSLLEQFEATTANNQNLSAKQENEVTETQPSELKLPTNVIERVREMRANRKKSILIPPKPIGKKSKPTNLSQQPLDAENVCRADPEFLVMEHDYCATEIPQNTEKTKEVNEFFDNIPECKQSINSRATSEKNTNYSRLPGYLTSFKKKKEYKNNKDDNNDVDICLQEEVVDEIDIDLRRSRSPSKASSASDCSTCSSSTCSKSCCDDYEIKERSVSRSKGHRSVSRGRSRHRKYSSGSPEYSNRSPCRSSSSHSSYEERYRSRSRSRSRNGKWVDRHWKRNPRRSPSYERNHLHRSRSPINRKNFDSYEVDSRSKYYRSMPKMKNAVLDQKKKNIDERKVIYVGNIPEGTTRDYLRKHFEQFGHILEVSVHFRDNRDNYGFITFETHENAYNAFENGNKDPNLKKFELCFGGRRQFCGTRYADLDNIEDEEKDCWGNQFQSNRPQKKSHQVDFDSLLQAAKSRLHP